MGVSGFYLYFLIVPVCGKFLPEQAAVSADGSLIQQTKSGVANNDAEKSLLKAETKLQSAEQKQSAGVLNAGNTISTTTGVAVQKNQRALNTENMKMEQLSAELESTTKAAQEEATLAYQQTSEMSSGMVNENNVVVATTKDATETVGTTKTDVIDAMKEKTGEKLFKVQNALNTLAQTQEAEGEVVIEDGEEFRDDTNEASAEAVESIEENQDEIQESSEEATDEAGELSEQISEMKAGNREANKGFAGTRAGLGRDVEKADQLVKNNADEASKDVIKTVEDLKKDQEETMDDTERSTEMDIKAMGAESKDAINEVLAELKDTRKETLGALTETENEKASSIEDASASTESLAKNVEQLAANEDILSETVDDVKGTASDAMDAAKETIDGKLKKAVSLISTESAKMETLQEQVLSSKVAQMEREREAGSAAVNEDVGETKSAQDTEMRVAAAETRQLTDELSNSAKKLQENADSDTRKLTDIMQTTENEQAGVAKASEELNKNVKNVGDEFQNALGETGASMAQFAAGVVAGVKKEGAEASIAAQKLAKDGQETLLQRIDDLDFSVRNRVATDQDNYDLQNTLIKSVVNNFQDTAQLAVGMKVDIDGAKAPIEEMITTAKDGMHVSEVQANLAFKETKDDVNTARESAKEKAAAQLTEENAATRNDLQEKAGQLEGNIKEQLTVVQDNLDTLTESEQKSRSETKLFEAKSMEQLSQAMKTTQAMKAASSAKDQQEKQAATNLVINIEDIARDLKRQYADLEQELKSANSVGMNTEDATAQATSKAVEKAANSQLEQGYENGLSALAKDEMTVKVFQLDKNKQIKALSDQLATEQTLATDTNGAANAMIAEQKRDMNALLAKSENIKADVSTAMQKSRKEQELQRAAIQADVQKAKTELRTTAQQKLSEDANGFASSMQQVETALDLRATKIKSEVSAFETTGKGEQAMVQKSLGSMDKQYVGMAAEFKNTLAGNGEKLAKYKQTVQLANDQARSVENSNTREVVAAQDHMIGGFEQLVGSLTMGEKKANDGFATLQEKFQSTAKYYQEQATNGISQVTGELNRVVAGTPGIADSFKADTAGTSDSLSSTLVHLNNSTGRVTKLISDMQERLDGVQAEREAEAKRMHDKISTMKISGADQMALAVSQISDMRRQARTLQRQMMKELNAFMLKVKSMESTTGNSDSALIDEMTAEVNKLQTTHEKTMDWKNHNQHYTAAWRNEVNSQLRNVQIAIGADEDEIRNAQINEDMDVNKDIRNMQERVDSEYADGEAGKANVFSKMVDGTLSKMQKMLGDQAQLDEKSDAESKGVEYAMKSNDALVDRELSGIDGNSEALTQKAAELKAKMKSAMQNITEEMLLPQLTASQKSREAQRHLGHLETQINQLASTTASSLLQSGDGQMRSEDSEAAQQAVMELNAQLESENAKMKMENKRLETGIESVKRLHHLVP